MTVFCGPSGSGKSSLAMDTIYAEGQRRYVESLSSYARQFVGQMQKPELNESTGCRPRSRLNNRILGNTPRSTVGTVDGNPRLSAYPDGAAGDAALSRLRRADGHPDAGRNRRTSHAVSQRLTAVLDGAGPHRSRPEVRTVVGKSASRSDSFGSASTARRSRWTTRQRSTGGENTGWKPSWIALSSRPILDRELPKALKPRWRSAAA